MHNASINACALTPLPSLLLLISSIASEHKASRWSPVWAPFQPSIASVYQDIALMHIHGFCEMPYCLACHGEALLEIWHAHRQAKRWRHTFLFLAELTVQWLNLLFYIMPNVYLLLHRCVFLFDLFKWSGWLSWTCWNTVSN